MLCYPFRALSYAAGAETFDTEDLDVVVVRTPASQFCEAVRAGTWEDHIKKIQTEHPTDRVVVMLEGLEAYSQAIASKSFGDGGCRAAMIPREKAEEVVNWMRILCGFDVHQVVNTSDCGAHIAGLASGLARAPYKLSATAATFATHKTRTGQGVDEAHSLEMAWVNMLMQIPKVTEEVARAISFAYPSFASLLQVYTDPTKSIKQKQELLQDLKRHSGNAESRRLGPALSLKVYPTFTTSDASELVD